MTDIHIRKDGHAGRITLNRPKALNALTYEMCLALEDALCEDFDGHDSLFNLLPVLENDREVKAVISIFQPE